MAHWIVKSEPASYSWNDLLREGGTEWTGVRNAAAALNLRAMKVGDTAFFYHSVTDKALVGIVRTTRTARPDGEGERWVSVAIEPVEPLARPITLAEIKATPALADMTLLRQSRLSVAPVTDAHWKTLLAMAAKPA